MKYINCTACGAPVLVKPSKESRNANHFCSRTCYDAFQKTGSLKNGYKVITVDGCQVLEHRYIMEASLGRKLSSDEHVHHVDENRLNNSISNLMVVTKEEHLTIHRTRQDLVDGQFVNLWNKGESTREIAKKIGCSQTEVRRRLIAADIDTSSRRAACAWDLSEAIALHEAGVSFAKIGAKFGVSGAAIRQAIKRRTTPRETD